MPTLFCFAQYARRWATSLAGCLFHTQPLSFVYAHVLTSLSFPFRGSGEPGKSTIVKKMKIIHKNGFSREELLTNRMTVYRILVDSARAIVLSMRKIGVDCETSSNRVSVLFYCISPVPSLLYIFNYADSRLLEKL